MPKLHHLSACVLLYASACAYGQSNIYVHVDANGTAHLTNVPEDSSYALLVGEEKPAPVAAPAAAVAAAPATAGKLRPQYVETIAEVAQRVGLEKALLHAVVATESNYNPRAVSNKGAAGLMQLMPQTARRYAVRDSFDPLQNLTGGALYLRDLIAMFSGDLKLALAAYNAGPEAVRTHGNRIPPFRETANYVPRVLDFYNRFRTSLM
jgi:soluble lytic murein transglycosylase-like protein